MNDLSDIVYEFLINPDGLGFNSTLAQLGLTLLMIVFWIFIGIILVRALKVVVYKVLKVKKQGARALTVSNLLISVLKYLIWFIVVLMILDTLNVNITAFVASAGVVGLAVGFGAQEIVKDFMSGFFIILDGSFNVGEVVQIDGFKGKVISLGLRTSILENWVGEQKIINNGDISSVVNYSRNVSVAIVDFGVAYDTDLNKVNEIMIPFVEEMNKKKYKIVSMPEFLGVTELADSSINLRIIAKTDTMKHFMIERAIRKDLIDILHKNQIEIPFPQVVVHNA